MVSQSTTSFDLSFFVSKDDSESYRIVASSNRMDKKFIARLAISEVKKDLVPRADQLRQNKLSLKEIQDFGQRLFEALVRDQVRDMYRTLEGQNISRESFTLILSLQTNELQRLPWECMFDPYRKDFLSERKNTHIIRKVETRPEGEPRETELGYTNFVIAIANPSNQPEINPEKEREFIERAIGELHQSGKLNRRYIQGSQTQIREALSEVPDVFHFIGHGGILNDVPGLFLEDSSGDSIFVTATKLENDYFKPAPGVNRRIRLIILSACLTSEAPKTEGYSSLAHQLALHADAVVAMQFPISLENLTKFNAALYTALAAGTRLKTAINIARRKIISDKLRGARDWISPVLVSQKLAPFQLISINPFMGPKYYDVLDRELFLSREREIQKLENLYKTQNIAVIKGESGCGKTSLLRAGLMANLISIQQPLVYISLAENLEDQLKYEINMLLAQNERMPLAEGSIEKLTDQFPSDLVILLDRVEQIEHLGDQVARIVTALIHWADGSAKGQHRKRLVIATRLDKHSEEPTILQEHVPEMEFSRLHLEMFDYDQATTWINKVTKNSGVTFLPETINAILIGLNYDHLEDRSMVALQVVCEAVFEHAQANERDEATPELLAALNYVDGILKQKFNIPDKYKEENKNPNKNEIAARKVLSQFVNSNKKSMRPRSWDDLYLRCSMENQELNQILDQLQEERLLRLEHHPGGDKYELVHELLVRQINWMSESDFKLRKLEEIIESTYTLIPLSGKGGLKELESRREELILNIEQQKLLLQSALEVGYETDYWFKRVKKPQDALQILTDKNLSEDAKECACPYLGKLGAREDSTAQKAKEYLRELAGNSASPRVRRAASLELAPLMDETFINQKFGEEIEELKYGIEALAIMFDSRWLPLKGLPSAIRSKIRFKLLQINMIEIIYNAGLAAIIGALGFALAVVWIYAQAYRSRAVTSLPPVTLLILEFILVGFLAFILALPGAFASPLGRDITSIVSGGRRDFPAAIGLIAGSALGNGLTVAILAALAEYRDPSLLRLMQYFISGFVLGGAIGLPWLFTARYSIKHSWLVLLVGLFSAFAFYGVSTWGSWWPASSFALTLDARYGWVTRIIPGILIGLGSTIGLTIGKLRRR